MNPDLLTALQRMLGGADAQRQPASREPIVTTAPRPSQPIQESPDARQRRLSQNYINSTLGDSLNALSGGGRPNASRLSPVSIALSRRGLGPSPSATYEPFGDKLSVPIDGPARNTVIHEYGHRRNFRTSEGRSALLDRTFAIPESNKDAAEYNRTNRAEAYAEAFQQAFQLLDQFRKSPNITPHVQRKMLESRERRHPGTTRLFNEMLAEPLYASHPLRKPQGER